MAVILLVSSLSWTKPTENIDHNGLALKGYDPVSYFHSGKAQKGNQKFNFQYNHVTYWFIDNVNKQEFLTNPRKYEPQFGGWCAYAVANSKSKVDIDPQSFLIQDGRLLLFYNGLWGDTRKKWIGTKNQDAMSFLKQADLHWPEVKSREP